VANFATSFSSVVDTGGKFATSVNDTGGKFAKFVFQNKKADQQNLLIMTFADRLTCYLLCNKIYDRYNNCGLGKMVSKFQH
jgi:hypothetical protein